MPLASGSVYFRRDDPCEIAGPTLDERLFTCDYLCVVKLRARLHLHYLMMFSAGPGVPVDYYSKLTGLCPKTRECFGCVLSLVDGEFTSACHFQWVNAGSRDLWTAALSVATCKMHPMSEHFEGGDDKRGI